MTQIIKEHLLEYMVQVGDGNALIGATLSQLRAIHPF